MSRPPRRPRQPEAKVVKGKPKGARSAGSPALGTQSDSPQHPAPTPSPSARRVALDLLSGALRRRRPLDEAFGAHPALSQLEPRDRAFARTLAATSLRRLGQIDAVLARCLERPLPAQGAAAQDALRLGACQLLFLGTPAHAAVAETMAILPPAATPYRGLVNAVLRRLAREGATMLRDIPEIPTNTPAWLWQGWIAAYGEATARAIAARHLIEPPLDLTLKNGAERAQWADRLGAEILPSGSLRLREAGAIEALPGFAQGAWWVQDAAAAFPARLLGDVAGRHVVDLCAAPGGKTLQLAASGARVTALDRSPERLKRVAENLSRTGLAADCVAADAAEWQPPEPADAVLLDAPCSATGTIRRHPDLPWIKRPEEIADLPALQRRLLEAAIAMTRPGGLVVYAVCSLEPAEGERLVAKLLAERAPVERVPVRAAEIGAPPDAITRSGELRTLPCHWADKGGMDGFYAVKLRRR
ncbi:MAG: RsmB/NOP family class I SAM-dependent RNA methyltransferase [Pseudomonadota bacterium]